MKWEYCEIEEDIGGPITGVHGKVTRFHSDGKHTSKEGNFGSILANMGEEGWEVVASNARIEAGLGQHHKINYLLKRLIEEK